MIGRFRQRRFRKNYAETWFVGTPREHRDAAPKFETPARGWLLYEGSLDDATESWYGDEGHHQSVSLWWPADHAWFVSTEVDFDSTYMGGSQSLIDALVAEPGIEALEIAVTAGITGASDTINPIPHRD